MDEGQTSLRGMSRTSHNTVCDNQRREPLVISLAHIMQACLRSMLCLPLIAPDVPSQHFIMGQVSHGTKNGTVIPDIY